MKQQINEIKRMQQLAAIKESLNEESIPAAQWKSALVNFIQTNLTEDIAELDMLNDVLREIIADNEQELADPANQDYLAESQLNENVVIKAKEFIKQNVPGAGNVSQNETFHFPLEEVDPEIVDYLNSNERLDTTVNNQSAIMYISDDEVVVEFGY